MSTSHDFAAIAHRGRQAFRLWRGTRPFWAGGCTLLAGSVILTPQYLALQAGDILISISTISGVSAALIGAVMIIFGVALWLRPEFRFVAGIVTMLLAVVALVTANLGAFLIGTLLGLAGGGLAIGWTDRDSGRSLADETDAVAEHPRRAREPDLAVPARQPLPHPSPHPFPAGQRWRAPAPQRGGSFVPRHRPAEWSQPNRPRWERGQPSGRS